MPHKPGGAVSGTFPSLKLGRLVAYASCVERDFLFFASSTGLSTPTRSSPFA